jgi:hypothetical protein
MIDDSVPLKEQAVEAILVRWQYSGIQWEPYGHGTGVYPPEPSSSSSSSSAAASGSKKAPAGFMELKGFPGVFVGVKEEVLGEIKDERPTKPRPSKDYLMTLSSTALKEMWTNALKNQRQALIDANGPEAERSALARALKDEVKTAESFDTDKADRQWAKALAAGASASAPTTFSSSAPSSSSSSSSSAAAKEKETPVKKEKKEEKKEEKKDKSEKKPKEEKKDKSEKKEKKEKEVKEEKKSAPAAAPAAPPTDAAAAAASSSSSAAAAAPAPAPPSEVPRAARGLIIAEEDE